MGHWKLPSRMFLAKMSAKYLRALAREVESLQAHPGVWIKSGGGLLRFDVSVGGQLELEIVRAGPRVEDQLPLVHLERNRRWSHLQSMKNENVPGES